MWLDDDTKVEGLLWEEVCLDACLPMEHQYHGCHPIIIIILSHYNHYHILQHNHPHKLILIIFITILLFFYHEKWRYHFHHHPHIFRLLILVIIFITILIFFIFSSLSSFSSPPSCFSTMKNPHVFLPWKMKIVVIL